MNGLGGSSRHAFGLYISWIRELYAEQRLPLMMILAWTQTDLARQEEGRHIREYLRHQKPLLNRETATLSWNSRFRVLYAELV